MLGQSAVKLCVCGAALFRTAQQPAQLPFFSPLHHTEKEKKCFSASRSLCTFIGGLLGVHRGLPVAAVPVLESLIATVALPHLFLYLFFVTDIGDGRLDEQAGASPPVPDGAGSAPNPEGFQVVRDLEQGRQILCRPRGEYCRDESHTVRGVGDWFRVSSIYARLRWQLGVALSSAVFRVRPGWLSAD